MKYVIKFKIQRSFRVVLDISSDTLYYKCTGKFNAYDLYEAESKKQDNIFFLYDL